VRKCVLSLIALPRGSGGATGYNRVTKLSYTFWRDESGATAVEYGLIATFIGIALIASMSALGTKLRAPFKDVANNLAS
jgi:pilus assembly protein Flp/PilA